MSMGIGRFIDIGKLERETRPLLLLGYTVAVIVHILGGLYLTFGVMTSTREDKADLKERIPIQINIRFISPSSDEPFHIRPRRFANRTLAPVRNKGMTLPQMHGFRKRNTDEYMTPYGITNPGHVASTVVPEFGPRHTPGSLGLGLTDDGTERTDERHIGITDEMIDIGHLDMGHYKGLVVIDPADKHNIKGFIHIPRAVFGILTTPDPETGIVVQNIRDFIVNAFSGIELVIDKPLLLSSRDLQRYPFLYLPSLPGTGTQEEIENVRKYFENGGFAFIEPFNMKSPDRQMRETLRILFPDNPLEVIPFDHPVFHCYYDVYDMESPSWSRDRNHEIVIEGIFLNGRLAVIYTRGCREVFSDIVDRGGSRQALPAEYDMTYPEYEAGEFSPRTASLIREPRAAQTVTLGNPKAYRLCINAFVYALTRQGTIARKLVDSSTVTVQTLRDMWQIQYREQWRETERSGFNPGWNGK